MSEQKRKNNRKEGKKEKKLQICDDFQNVNLKQQIYLM